MFENKKNSFKKTRVLVLVGLVILLVTITVYPADVDILTSQEREWLKKHGPVRYAPDPSFFPFEFIGSDARAYGITPDILNLISEKLKIDFITIRCRTWNDVLDSVKRGDVDLLGTLTRTEERESFLRFSSPYLNVPVVLFVHKNKPRYADPRNLKGRRVGVVGNYGAESWLRQNHPEFELVTVSTSREGLFLVEMEQIDAFVEVLPVGVSIVAENSLFSVRHSIQPLYTTPQHFAVIKTNDVLLGIIEKGLSIITEKEKQEIFHKWAKEMPVSDNSLLETVLVILGIVLAFVIVFRAVVKSLRQVIKRQTEEIRKSESLFKGMFHNNPLAGALIELETGKFLEINKKFEEISGYKEEELKGRTTIETGFWINPAERARLVEKLKKDRVVHGFEQDFRVKGGKILNIIIFGQVFEIEGREVVLYLMDDVTEKRKIELMERRLADIVESSDAFIITSDVNLNISYLNASAQKNLRISTKSKIYDILQNSEKNRLTEEILPAIVKSGVWKGELTLSGINGNPIPTLSVAVAHKKTDGTIDYYSFIFRDIINLKKAYEALEDREEKLRQIIENSPQMFYVHDTSFRLKYISPQVKDILGYEEEEMIGRVTKEFLSDNPVNEIGNELSDLAIRTGERQRPYEIELIAKDGKRVWGEIHESPVVLNGKTIAVVGSLTDITQKKQIEFTLKEREALLEGIARNSPDLIIVFNIIRREAIYSNKNFAEFLGYTGMQQFNFVDLMKLIPDEDLNKLLEHFDEMSSAEFGSIHEIEYRVQKKDGNYMWIRARDSVFRKDESGNVVEILSIQQDITKEKKIELEKEEAKKREFHLNKMQALGELASGVAHDINNWLTVLKSGLPLLSMKPGLSSEDFQCLQEAMGSVEQMENLARQLLVFSRKEVMEIKPADINQIVLNAQKMLRRSLRENIEIKLDLSPGLPIINVDSAMIQNALMNLVSNSRDAMPGAGTITITTKLVDAGTEVVLKAGQVHKGKYIMLKVTDTGTGISREIIDRIFEPYFTTKDPGKGTGMGLSIVHGIVAQHGGWIDVESEVGKGTSFMLYFPIPVNLVEKPKLISEKPVKLLGGKETILIVEDNESVRKMAVVCLRRLGYNVLESTNGVTALKLVENYQGTIHLLFTDMIMPGDISGLELYERLKEKIPSLKVLYTSGHPGEVLQIQADLLASGIFLKKPYDPVTLSEKVRECLSDSN